MRKGKRKQERRNEHVGTRNISIEKLSMQQLQGYAAYVWIMSMPFKHTKKASLK